MPPSRKSSKVKPSRKTTAGRRAFLSNLKKLEKRVGQKNLANMIGVDPRSLRRYKQGTRTARFDIVAKVNKAARVAKGLRRTKSINLKTKRAVKALLEHPELPYFEKLESYKYSDTDHIILYDVAKEDIESLIAYLIEKDCGASYFVISGVDKNDKRRFYSSEVMEINDFAESWEDILNSLRDLYDFRNMSRSRIDLVGIIYNAPSPIQRS
jgi:hypothetical protein